MQTAEYFPPKSNVLAVELASSARLTSTSGKQQPQHACCPPPWCYMHTWHSFLPITGSALITFDTHRLLGVTKSHFRIIICKWLELSSTHEVGMLAWYHFNGAVGTTVRCKPYLYRTAKRDVLALKYYKLDIFRVISEYMIGSHTDYY